MRHETSGVDNEAGVRCLADKYAFGVVAFGSETELTTFVADEFDGHFNFLTDYGFAEMVKVKVCADGGFAFGQEWRGDKCGDILNPCCECRRCEYRE